MRIKKRNAQTHSSLIRHMELAQGDQQVVGVDGGADGSGDSLDGAGAGSGNLDLHLHGLEHDQHVAGVDGIANLALNLEDVAGHGAVDSSLTGSSGLQTGLVIG